MTESYNQNTGIYDDSLGSQVINAVVNSGNGSPRTYIYTGGDGSSSDGVTVSYTNYHLLTVFGCTGTTEINWPYYLPTTVAIKGGGTFTIGYETTPGYSGQKDSSGLSYVTGRLGSVVYPSGGSVTYGYSGGNNGVNCSTKVVPTLTRTINDNNGNVKSETYVNSDNSSANFTVVKNDPANSQTVYNFSTEFQTQEAVYQGGCPTSITGCAGGGTLLKTITTCYGINGAAPPVPPNCATPSTPPRVPITETDVYTSVNTSSSSILKTTFDTYGNTTSVLVYDFSVSTPMMQTFTSYGQSWNGTSCSAYPSGIFIYNTPCYSHTENSSGTDIAKTQITYNNAGHPTSVAKWTGSSWLTSSATYNSNGTVATATDVNGTVSTYAYNGTGGCISPALPLLPTSITTGGLTTSTQWDCNGGIPTQTTDANGQVITYTYNDPLWRRTSKTDPLGNVTSYSYTPTSFESALNFNSTSTMDTQYAMDGLGRTIKSQLRTAPGASTFDNTIVYGYGWNSTGSFTTQTIPGGTAATTTQYDALGRPLSVTDGGGGTISNTYAQNDVVSALGPPATGENSKQTQNEYDSLGRLTKSCGIGNGSTTSCGQATGSANGVSTVTTYSSAAGSQTVSSARGSQTRSQTVDGLGRVTSKTTPEGGTVTNVYDTLPSACNNRAFANPGKLIYSGFANGNFSCYQYDSLGRVTAITGVSGSNYLCRRFFYDNSSGATGTIPSGITISNPYGRVVEAETDNCNLPITPITDEWFSYDKVGHLTDIWEHTPHSGTYYHSAATFAANGFPLTVQLANPNLYTMTYGLDGEGRPSTLQEGTQTIVAGTTFNPASQPTYIDLGTGTDQSDYIYDPNTGRMTKWTFQVGSTSSETGTLTWNPNGTLKTLAINDGFNAGGTQNCNFNPSLATGTGYDDLGRLIGVDCGSGGWGQTFSYDQYDNITKSVPSGRTGITWNPSYYAANSHYLSGATYDSSGNVTWDTFHNYTWDAYGKLSSIDSSACGTNGECITYDALGRIVETSYNSAYTEIWYTQLGKVYMTGGTTPYYAYWPTPGNGTVEVNGNAATNFYMHKDWLGNARISSTLINHTVVSDQAYAPYGEVYDKLATGAGVPGQMFTGDTQDILTGIFDTANRELNASQGRWLSPDPALQGWNQYGYVNGNPMSYVDPSGLACYPLERAMTGSCAPFMNNGVSFGANWNEFDLMFSTIQIYAPKWVPFPLNQAGPNMYWSSGYATTWLSDGYYLGWGPIGDGLDAALVFSGRLQWTGAVVSAVHPPVAIIKATLPTWQRLIMQVGCLLGQQPDNYGPAPSDSVPQDSTDSTVQTEGQQQLYGPNKSGGTVVYNTGSQVPSAAAGGSAHVATASDCLNRVPD